MATIAFDDLLGVKLDPGETCDRCGPSTIAMIAFRLPSGRKLAFCMHHARRHADALDAQGAVASTDWPVPGRKETV